MITLNRIEWIKISSRIREDYKETPAVYMLRSKMREVLGCTVREEYPWIGDTVYLDFYDEPKKTLFILKYL